MAVYPVALKGLKPSVTQKYIRFFFAPEEIKIFLRFDEIVRKLLEYITLKPSCGSHETIISKCLI